VIKASGALKDGTPVVVLGLSGEDMTELISHEPITFDLTEFGLPGAQFIIVGGRTDETILDQLRTHIPLEDPS
jgi:hypothetical protein